MKGISSEVVGGAALMVSLRLIQRGLGVISTAVLARLLVPADFGIVAMALSVVALVDLLSVLGFDLALIRTQSADRQHLDTAWTLGLIFKAVAAVIIALSSHYVAGFYNEPKLAAVLYVYSAIVFVNGFENIGIVAFRRDLNFDREFRLQLANKLLAVIVTVILAATFRSYWALALGSLFGGLTGVGLSYVMHEYRPRPSLKAWKGLLGFSSWVLFNNLTFYLRDRGPDFLVGRMVGAQMLGTYRVSSEVAALPTTELYAPMMRVVFPGFARIKDDADRLRRAYLLAQAAVTAATLPAAVLVLVLAEPIVGLLLGPSWQQAVPLIKILCLYGITSILHGNRFSLFMALGRPGWIGAMVIIELCLMFPMMWYGLTTGRGVEAAAWAKVAASLTVLPFGILLVSRVLAMGRREMLSVLWRPCLSALVMGSAMVPALAATNASDALFGRLVAVLGPASVGAVVYVVTTLGLWALAGRPDGIERKLLLSGQAARVVPARARRWLLGRHFVGDA